MNISHHTLAHLLQANEDLGPLLPHHRAELAHNQRLFQGLVERFPAEPFSLAEGTATKAAFDDAQAAAISLYPHLPTLTDPSPSLASVLNPAHPGMPAH